MVNISALGAGAVGSSPAFLISSKQSADQILIICRNRLIFGSGCRPAPTLWCVFDRTKLLQCIVGNTLIDLAKEKPCVKLIYLETGANSHSYFCFWLR